MLRNMIYKYTKIYVENESDNLLDYPILAEYWLYILLELEEQQNIPIIKLLSEIDCEDFTLKSLNSKLNLSA